ncbi:MAG: hypothetical protein N2512_13130 [Armatimonadetes bacterium]|nr:hypothetical protein [Armatimonadota bacterium]
MTGIEQPSQLAAEDSEYLRIDAKGLHYRLLNERIREAIGDGRKYIEVVNVHGQRYIGDGIQAHVQIDIYGIPGNDLAIFMDGAEVVVHNNAQDAVGNTLNSGRVIVHGDAGDVIGYGMRGGKVFIRGDVGYRVGIHMKEEPRRKPVLIVGGTAADFLGEYLAGGVLIVLGLTDTARRGTVVGDYCGTGMHGGRIYLRGTVEEDHIAERFAEKYEATEEDLNAILPDLAEFCEVFGFDLDKVLAERFWVVKPSSRNPYGASYVPNP